MAKQNFKHVCFCMGASVMAILCVLPSFGAVNPTIKKLLAEKKQKMAQLEQCAQKVKGFKIAGISTLGLTAVGIGGNIALATKNAKLEKTINGTDGLNSQIQDEQDKIDKLDTKIAAEEQRVAEEKQKAIAEKAAKEEAERKAKEEAEQKAKEEAARKEKEDQLNKDKEDCAKKGKTWRWVEEEEKCKEKDPVVVLGQSCANSKNGIKTASYVKANSGATKCWKDNNKKKEDITPCYCKVEECDTDTHKLEKSKCVAKSNEEIQKENIEKEQKIATLEAEKIKAAQLDCVKRYNNFIKEYPATIFANVKPAEQLLTKKNKEYFEKVSAYNVKYQTNKELKYIEGYSNACDDLKTAFEYEESIKRVKSNLARTYSFTYGQNTWELPVSRWDSARVCFDDFNSKCASDFKSACTGLGGRLDDGTFGKLSVHICWCENKPECISTFGLTTNSPFQASLVEVSERLTFDKK